MAWRQTGLGQVPWHHMTSLYLIGLIRLYDAEPLTETMLDNRTHGNIFQWNLNQNTTIFIEEMYLNFRLQNDVHFVPVAMC